MCGCGCVDGVASCLSTGCQVIDGKRRGRRRREIGKRRAWVGTVIGEWRNATHTRARKRWDGGRTGDESKGRCRKKRVCGSCKRLQSASFDFENRGGHNRRVLPIQCTNRCMMCFPVDVVLRFWVGYSYRAWEDVGLCSAGAMQQQ